MTTPTTTAPERAAPAPAAPTAPATGPRRVRWPVAVTLALVLAIAAAAWAGRDDATYPDPLDPRNPGADGAQAVAKVLADDGVDVTIARSADELAAAGVDDRTTVLVTGAERLAPSTIDQLREEAAPGLLVLADPPSYVLDEIDHLDTRIDARVDEVAAGCADLGLEDGLELTVDTATAYDADGCFPTAAGDLLVTGSSGTVYLGAADALTNDQVLRGDNAAVALRLLGQRERLVWYVPSYDDTVPGESVSLSALLPAWLVPGLWMAFLALVGLVLWRVRRLGPLSTEPLPVVVRAVETAQSRGRMYRKGGDRAHAAEALRAAARRRIADRLALGRGAEESAVVAAAAERLGRPHAEVGALLSRGAPPPATDHDLVRLGQELSQITREVRRG